MGDRQARDANSNSAAATADQRTDQPVRSRWTPKPEQILILESIFNSGMVNPPKEETIRIRKILQKFGAVGDANVFYWFQNRRSRSRRRQRQIQANLNGPDSGDQSLPPPPPPCGNIISFEQNYSTAVPPGGFPTDLVWNYQMNGMDPGLLESSSSSLCEFGGSSDNFFSFSNPYTELQMPYDANPNFCLTDTSNFPSYQPEVMTVFINGVATEVMKGGAVDIKGMFGGDYILFHSSGMPVEVDEYGFVVQGSLQHGESYFLMPRRS